MKTIPFLLAGARAWLGRRPDQDLIDATEDLMVNGLSLADARKPTPEDLKQLFDTLNNAPLKPTHMEIPEDVYDDIVAWSKGSPSGEGQVE